MGERGLHADESGSEGEERREGSDHSSSASKDSAGRLDDGQEINHNGRPVADLGGKPSYPVTSENQASTSIENRNEERKNSEDAGADIRSQYQKLQEENIQLRLKLEKIRSGPFSLLGGEPPHNLGKLAVCNVTFQAISSECRRDIEQFIVNRLKEDDCLGQEYRPMQVGTPQHGPKWIQYYDIFCVDKLGLRNCEDDIHPSLYAVHVPEYNVEPDFVIGEERDESEIFGRGGCWNCGRSGHSYGDCDMPLDEKRLEEARSEFISQRRITRHRYHEEEDFSHLQPGQPLSQELLDALGIGPYEMPPWIPRMHIHGYPPGWRKRLKSPVLGLIGIDDGPVQGDEVEDRGVDEIKYPGFNAPPVSGADPAKWTLSPRDHMTIMLRRQIFAQIGRPLPYDATCQNRQPISTAYLHQQYQHYQSHHQPHLQYGGYGGGYGSGGWPAELGEALQQLPQPQPPPQPPPPVPKEPPPSEALGGASSDKKRSLDANSTEMQPQKRRRPLPPGMRLRMDLQKAGSDSQPQPPSEDPPPPPPHSPPPPPLPRNQEFNDDVEMVDESNDPVSSSSFAAPIRRAVNKSRDKIKTMIARFQKKKLDKEAGVYEAPKGKWPPMGGEG